MKINKFAVLNAMQRNTHKVSGINGAEKSWDLIVTYTYKGVTRSRCVAFIGAFQGKYWVSRDTKKGTYKTFMAALAALFQVYCDECHKLVLSMRFGELQAYSNSYALAVCEVTESKGLDDDTKGKTLSSDYVQPTYRKGEKKNPRKALRDRLNTFWNSQK